MIKRKLFKGSVGGEEVFDKLIDDFFKEIADNEYTIIHYNTIACGYSKGYIDKLRTEIIYRENTVRRVIVEKNKKENENTL